jgi:hypothetical protein
MDREYINKSLSGNSNVKSRGKKNSQINILHQNICSFKNKVTELEVWLNSELCHIDVICLTEHWLKPPILNITYITNFRLTSAYCRQNSSHGSSCIYVKDNIVVPSSSLNEDFTFTLSITDLIDHNLLVVCIYRSPDGQIDIILKKLEYFLSKLTHKKNSLVLCGDWNINTFNDNRYQKDLLGLLERYNMVSTVITPTKETNKTKSLIDMTIIYRAHYQMPSSIYELGLSDHHAQTLLIKTRESINTPIKNWKRHINERSISDFSNSLNNIS